MSKTEQASPRRLREARRRGDSPRSPLLVGAASLAAFLLLAPAWLSALLARFQDKVETALGFSTQPAALARLALGTLSDVLWLTVPLALTVSASALLVGLVQVRGQLRLASASKQGERKWLRNPLSREKLSSLAAGWLAFAALVGLGALSGGWALRQIMGSLGSVQGALQALAAVAQSLGWAALGLIAASGLAGFALQHAAWLARLRMSRGERLQEQREAEGDPGLRRYRKRLEREAEPALTAALVQQATLVLQSASVAVLVRYTAPAEAAVVLLKVRGQAAARAVAQAQAADVTVVFEPELAEGLARIPSGGLARTDAFPGLSALVQ